MPRRYTGGFLSSKEQVTDANSANGIFTTQEAGALTTAGSFPTGRWATSRSLRFRSSVGAYFNKSFGADGNRKTWTLSFWIKRGKIASDQHLWSSAGANHPGGADIAYIGFTGDDRFVTYMYPNGGPAAYYVGTNRLFRDPAAWYHIVLHMDTSLAIQTNRIKIYVNGVQETSLQNTSYPSTDYASSYINSTRPQIIGHEDGRWRYPLNGHLAEFNFIDGQALDASNFGYTDPSTGAWVPKRYTGTYGTNGFYLDFKDNSSLSNLGLDRSGNSNNFTQNNFSLTTGITYDSVVDVPGITSVSSQPDIGGVQRGNYCTLNPLANGTNLVVDSGLLSVSNSTTESNHRTARAHMGMTTGKWYWEVHVNNSANVDIVGIVTDISSPNTYVGATANSFGWGYNTSSGSYYGAGEWLSSGTAPAFPSSGIIGIALDLDAGKIWFSSNGNWLTTATGVGNPSFGICPTATYGGLQTTTFFPAVSIYYNTGTWNFNFGQRPFAYTPPTGFKTLNTTNLPTPVIKRPSEHFDVKTYTGNGTSLQVGTTPKQISTFSTSSLEFKSELTSHLTRTLTTPTSAKAWTFSAWVKRAKIGSAQSIFISTLGGAGVPQASSYFTSSDTIQIYDYTGSAYTFDLTTSQTFKDTSAWYHLVFVYDSAANSTSNRVRLYVNGTQITSFSSASFPSLNADCSAFNRAYAHYLSQGNAQYFDGYMAEVNFVDGQSLTPSSFGVYDANNNWMPQRYTGTYGTNGFYLPLSKPTDTPVMSYGATFTGGNVSSTQLVTSTNANLALGTNNFTVEYWYTRTNPATGGETALTFGTGQDTYAPLFGYSNPNGSLQTYMSSNGSAWDIVSGNTIARPTVAGQWNHIAITRSGNTFTAYHNGKQTTTWTSSASIFQNANSVSIGKGQGGNGAGNASWQGMISNVRVVIGSVLYTGNFTPSTTPFTAVANTRLLTLQDSTIIDNSTNALTFTNTGSVAVSDASPWQRTVGYDASGSNNNWYPVNFDYSVPRSTVLTYGTPGTYTWVAPAGVTSVKALVIAGGGAGGSNGGGGGAGGMIYNAAVAVTPGNSYTVTVGRGGHTRNQGNATNSVFSSLTAIAGGNGATYGVVGAQNGGSGGGGTLGNNTPGTGTAGQGNAGGAGNNGNAGNTYYHGGGGGAGGTGFAGGDSRGGPGLVNSITGVPIYYAGGGGAHYFITNTAYYAVGGIGGGGTGVGGRSGPAAGGTPNSGGGGGGTSAGLGGGPGGSGVVILSYTNAASYVGTGANSIVASDVVKNAPTDFEDSTGVSGNYAILDYANYPISNSNSGNTYNITNAGLTLMSDSSGAHKIVPATMPVSSGKWYFEMILESDASDAYSAMGLIPWPLPNHDYLTNLPSSTSTTNGFSWQAGNTNNFTFWTDYIGGAARYVTVNPISAAAIGDVMQIAIDIDNNKIWVGRNNVWYDASGGSTGNPSTGANPTATNVTRYIGQYGALIPFCSVGQENMITANFGQSGFMYTPPTGFKAINSKNLKDSGSTNLPDTFGNFVNTPDLVWIKNRTAASGGGFFNTVIGPTRFLQPTNTNGLATTSGELETFLPNGFMVGTNGNITNNSGNSYVAWNWNRGKTPGFDIVNYGGDGVNGRMIPHNLGQVPAFYITKCLTSYNNTQGFTDWSVYHQSCPTYTGNSRQGKQALWLHSILGAANGVGGFFNNATSTEFSPNQINYDNSLGQSYIAYLWAEVPGFSKFGGYTGNNDNNGPFVYLGFRPRFILLKKIGEASTTYGWQIYDTARSPANLANLPGFWADATAAEAPNTYAIDLLSNGFKIKTNNANMNNGSTFVYAAWAESPFKYATAR